MPVPALLTTQAPDPVLRVDVYYECLCPDSRYDVMIDYAFHQEVTAQGGVGNSRKHDITTQNCFRYFVLNHLLPTMEKVGSLMDIRLWPYGKAETHDSETGEQDRMIRMMSVTITLTRPHILLSARPGGV